MSSLDIIALIVTTVAVASFSAVFTILFGSYTKGEVKSYKEGRKDPEIINGLADEKQKQKAERRKKLEPVKRVIGSVFTALVAILFVLAIVNRISGNATSIGNKTLMVVASGSMSEKNEKNKDYLVGYDNQFPTYSIIVLEKVESAASLKKYDVIAYVNDKGVNIIHRIVNINSDGTYTTRGDANNESDSDHPSFDRVIGRYTGKYLPSIGVFILFFQSYSGIVTVVAVIYCMIMMDNRTKAMNDARENRTLALKQALGVESFDQNGEATAEFIEKLYLDKFIYTIDPSGLVTEEARIEILTNNPKPEEIIAEEVEISSESKENNRDGENAACEDDNSSAEN